MIKSLTFEFEHGTPFGFNSGIVTEEKSVDMRQAFVTTIMVKWSD